MMKVTSVLFALVIATLPDFGKGWQSLDGKLKVIAAADGKIVGVNSKDQIFFRTGVTVASPKGSGWQQIPGALKYIAEGDGKIGGVNSGDQIYFRTGITDTVPQGTSWQRLSGALIQLSIGDGKIMGVNRGNMIYYRTGISSEKPFGTGWRSLSGRLKYISVGDGKIAGVNRRNQIYVRTGVSSTSPFGTGWKRLPGSLKMIEVGNGRMVGANRYDNIYERVGVTAAKPDGVRWHRIGGKLKHVTLGDGKMIGVNSADTIYYLAQNINQAGLASAATVTSAPITSIAGWNTVDGKLKEIAAADGKIVGVNSKDQIFFRTGVTVANPKGSGWQQIPGGLKYIAEGDGKIGGVNSGDQIYFRTGITGDVPQGTGWQRLSGALKQLSIGDGKIMGVNRRDVIYYRSGISSDKPFGTGWRSLSGRLKYISVGDGKIAGVNSRNQIYVRSGVTSASQYGTGWKRLPGSLKMIEVGNGRMVGANSNNNIYERVGVTSSNPAGGNWQQLKGQLKHVTLGDGKMMGVNNGDNIFYQAQAAGSGGGLAAPITAAPVVTVAPLLAEKIYGAVPKRTQDYVKFDIKINNILGHSLRRNFRAAQTCPDGKGVTGFRLKQNAGSKRVVGMEMICQDGTKMIEESQSGDWQPWLHCDSQETKDTQNYVIGLKYRSRNRHGMTQLIMECSNNKKQLGPQGFDEGEFSSVLYSGCPTTAKLCGYAAEEGHHRQSAIGRIKVLCCSKAADNMAAQGEWKPLGNNICIGAKDDHYGFLRMPVSGFLAGLKFEYLDGALSCATRVPLFLSRFGCNYAPYITRAFAIYVTKVDKALIFPQGQRNARDKNVYMVLGKNAKTADNFTLNAANPEYVGENEEIQFWYQEDYHNRSEHDNGGLTCVRVYGKVL